ncbi:MAG: adenylosuccinate lyase [Euryarchaeota archaeon]|nr:adenylosuccinate lyase [Euryarchaeota archaeon]
MPVCPLEFRYGRKEMKAIWSEEGKLQAMLDVEAALVLALAEVGRIPLRDAKMIASKANVKTVTVERVDAIEREISHDIMAVVRALSEQSGASGGYVHLGATSNDIIDTATAVQLKRSIVLLLDDLQRLKKSLIALASKHKRTVMVGRTHGQFAVPVTFGLKMAVFAAETQRHIHRLEEARGRICVGKLSGAVGTGAALGKDALDVQEKVMARLGISHELAATQLVGRDRYAEFVLIMANIAASLERFATEVRNLQRSELGEVSEAFDAKKQVGSSTMPHKRNPIMAENVCGLARTLRGFAGPAMENVVLWHERDLTNSSAERFILPHVCALGDDIINKSAKVFETLGVNEGTMRKNLESAEGLIMAEAVMVALVAKGMGRQEAHELTRKCAMKAYDTGIGFRKALLGEPKVRKLMTQKEIEIALDPANYLGSAVKIVDEVIAKLKR